MKYVFYVILIITASFTLLSGTDTITMSDGGIMEGQLLKVTKQALIIEVLSDSNQVSTISLDHNQVISVVDESEESLYKEGIQQEEDLEDYYKKRFAYLI